MDDGFATHVGEQEAGKEPLTDGLGCAPCSGHWLNLLCPLPLEDGHGDLLRQSLSRPPTLSATPTEHCTKSQGLTR